MDVLKEHSENKQQISIILSFPIIKTDLRLQTRKNSFNVKSPKLEAKKNMHILAK